jgi:transposase-like protein
MRPLSTSLFHGRHFDRAIIVLCVSWYITYKLSYRDLVELMAERGVDVSHTTILRWVQHYVSEFEKRWGRYARPVGTSWRVDETYIRVRGRWTYLYRAVDKRGLTGGFLLSEHRDISAAKQFFTRAIERHGAPQRIRLDGYPASHPAAAEFKKSEATPLSDARLQEVRQRSNRKQRGRTGTEDQEGVVRHHAIEKQGKGADAAGMGCNTR